MRGGCVIEGSIRPPTRRAAALRHNFHEAKRLLYLSHRSRSFCRRTRARRRRGRQCCCRSTFDGCGRRGNVQCRRAGTMVPSAEMVTTCRRPGVATRKCHRGDDAGCDDVGHALGGRAAERLRTAASSSSWTREVIHAIGNRGECPNSPGCCASGRSDAARRAAISPSSEGAYRRCTPTVGALSARDTGVPVGCLG